MGDSLEATLRRHLPHRGQGDEGKVELVLDAARDLVPAAGDALADYTFGDVEKGWAEDLSSDSGSSPTPA